MFKDSNKNVMRELAFGDPHARELARDARRVVLFFGLTTSV
jgi:hypothetical protein